MATKPAKLSLMMLIFLLALMRGNFKSSVRYFCKIELKLTHI